MPQYRVWKEGDREKDAKMYSSYRGSRAAFKFLTESFPKTLPREGDWTVYVEKQSTKAIKKYVIHGKNSVAWSVKSKAMEDGIKVSHVAFAADDLEPSKAPPDLPDTPSDFAGDPHAAPDEDS